MDNFDGFNMVVIWDDYTFAAFTNASTGEIEMTIDDFNANNIMENIILFLVRKNILMTKIIGIILKLYNSSSYSYNLCI